jgi:cell division protein ZapA
MKGPHYLTVRILDHEYQVNCPDGGRDALLAAAEYLNQRMGAIRKKGKTLSMERIAVMTALNMAHEMMDQKQGKSKGVDRETGERLQQLQLRIDAAVGE